MHEPFEVFHWPPKSRTLCREVAAQIRDENSWGKRLNSLAVEFGVAPKKIKDVLDRVAWGDER